MGQLLRKNGELELHNFTLQEELATFQTNNAEDLHKSVDVVDIEGMKREMIRHSLESSLGMKEEIEVLKAEIVSKYSQVDKLESGQHVLQQELDFYKGQNEELLQRLDDLEISCITDAEALLLHDKGQGGKQTRDNEKRLKEKSSAQTETIATLKH